MVVVWLVAVALVLGTGAWGAAASADTHAHRLADDCSAQCPAPTDPSTDPSTGPPVAPPSDPAPVLTDEQHPFPSAGRGMQTSANSSDEWWEPRAFHGDVYVMGDSITRGGTAQLHRLHPLWQVNGVPGRRVYTLPTLLQYRIDHGPKLKKVVIALGTNADPTWTRADYVRVTRMLPASTDIVFVSTYRNPKLWPATLPYYERAPLQSYYSDWMGSIATSRRHTCVVRWRTWASTHKSMLRDGTHPLLRAKKEWAKLVSKGVLGCS